MQWCFRKAEERINLNIDLTVSNGEYVSSVDFMDFIFPEPSSMSGIRLLLDICIEIFNLEKKALLEGDVTLRFEDGTIRAHWAILAAWSPVFRRMFHSDMKEQNSGEANIEDFDSDTGWRFLYSRGTISGQYSKDAQHG